MNIHLLRTRATTTFGALLIAVFEMPVHARVENHSLDFVAEHLPEVAMDNRIASLPLWTRFKAASPDALHFSVQGAYADTRANTLKFSGQMLSVAVARPMGDEWQFSVFGFIDEYRLSGGIERRPLDVTFARVVPLSLPAQTEFSGLSGSARHTGIGIALRQESTSPRWGRYLSSAGILWQRFSLRDYAFDYRVLEGASAGARGRIDYSTTYAHLTPFVGMAWPRDYDEWMSTPHVKFALPMPRRGVVGQITGPGFVAGGDTASSGQGRHFGDASITFGWDIGYRPWRLSVDIGSVLSQALLEPIINKGVRYNRILSFRWDY
jgi:hypothetical protein